MNCVPAAGAALEPDAICGVDGDEIIGALAAGPPVNALTASSFGCALPKPQPPSRS